MELFTKPGATVLVDGQFGSTGKGLFAGWIAENYADKITKYTTNAAPNSGHTAFYNGEKIMTQQLPVAAVIAARLGLRPFVLINAGATVDPAIFHDEQLRLGVNTDNSDVYIHPCAAEICDYHRELDRATVDRISSTGKGTGPAMIGKIQRRGPPPFQRSGTKEFPNWDAPWDWSDDRVFVETAQGFSLGINSERFYPYTTSRECTVMQAIADARIPAQMVDKVIMTVRTYPIRVGNAPGSYSGEVYPDQREITWEELGQTPELTTVTKRVRRVFTWSRIQFMEACAANRPDVIFLNFVNYLGSSSALSHFIRMIEHDYRGVMGHELRHLYIGKGPLSSDVERIDV